MWNIIRGHHSTLQTPALVPKTYHIVHDELVYRVELLISLDFKTLPCWVTEEHQTLILNKSSCAPSFNQGGPMTKPHYPPLPIPIGLSDMSSLCTMVLFLSKVVLLFLYHSALIYCVHFTLPTLDRNSLFVMHVTMCIGQVSPTKSQTCANVVSHVSNMLTRILGNHCSLTLCLPYLGSWSRKTCSNSMATPSWSQLIITVTTTSLISFSPSNLQSQFKSPNDSSVAMESL